MTCCCIDPGETAEFHSLIEIKKSRKPYLCCECRRTIPAGYPYRLETAIFEGNWNRYRTCRLCASVRDDRFTCGWIWGELWEHLRYCLEGDCECDETGACDCNAWLDPPTHPIRSDHRQVSI